MRDNLPLNTKKKSKFSHVSLEAESGCLSIVPFGAGKYEEKPFTLPLGKLSTIHKKYVEEGKMTLEFLEKAERVVARGMDVMAG